MNKSTLFSQISHLKRNKMNIDRKSSKMSTTISKDINTMKDIIGSYNIDKTFDDDKKNLLQIMKYRASIEKSREDSLNEKANKEKSKERKRRRNIKSNSKEKVNKSYSNAMIASAMYNSQFRTRIQSARSTIDNSSSIKYHKVTTIPYSKRSQRDKKISTPTPRLKRYHNFASSTNIINLIDKTNSFTIYDIERYNVNVSSSVDLIRKINKDVFKFKRYFTSNPFLTPSLNSTKYSNIKNVIMEQANSQNKMKKSNSAINMINKDSSEIESKTNRINLEIQNGIKMDEKFKEKEGYDNERKEKMKKTLDEVNKMKRLILNKGDKRVRMDKFQRITQLNKMKKELDALSSLNDRVAFEQRKYFEYKLGMIKKKDKKKSKIL